MREPKRSAYARGYTKEWDRKSKAFRRTYPLCGMRPHGRQPVMSQCWDQGRTTAATCTDHVTPHRGDKVLFNSIENWQALCGECHTRKTNAGY